MLNSNVDLDTLCSQLELADVSPEQLDILQSYAGLLSEVRSLRAQVVTAHETSRECRNILLAVSGRLSVLDRLFRVAIYHIDGPTGGQE